MEYSASLGNTPKITTTVVTLLFAALIIWPVITIKDNGVPSVIYLTSALLIVYFGAFIYSPRKYSITENALVIHRIIGNVTIKKSDIQSVETYEKGLPFALRTFGVGGLFGYFGNFYNSDIGNMNWYITRRDRTVLIKTVKGKKILLSPDDRESFVEALKA